MAEQGLRRCSVPGRALSADFPFAPTRDGLLAEARRHVEIYDDRLGVG